MRVVARWGKICAAALAAAGWLLGGAGCSSGPETVTPKSAGTATTASTAAAAAPASTTKPFVIGVVVPLSGPKAVLGQSLKRGAELAAAEVNAAGGFNGRRLTLAIYDTQSDLTEGSKAVQTCRDRETPVILLADSNLAAYLAEEVAKYPQLFGFLCDYVSVPTVTPKNGIRVYLNGDQEARAIVDYINACALTKVALLNLNDYAGRNAAKYLDFLLQDPDLQRQTYTDVYALTDRDFRILADTMRRIKAQSLVLAGWGREYPALLAAFEYTGWNGLVFGYLNQGNFTGLSGLKGLAATALYPVPEFAVNPRGTPAGRAFADAFRAKHGADPDLPAAYAYDNIHVLAAGAKAALSVQSLKIREGFLSLGTYTGAAGTYTIKHDGDTEMPLVLVNGDGQPAPPPVKLAEAAPAEPAKMSREQLNQPGVYEVFHPTQMGTPTGDNLPPAPISPALPTPPSTPAPAPPSTPAGTAP